MSAKVSWPRPALRWLDTQWERWWARHTYRVLGARQFAALPYLGYAAEGRVRCLGQILHRPLPAWDQNASALENALAIVPRILRPVAPGVPLRLSAGGAEISTETDLAGRWDVTLEYREHAISGNSVSVAVTFPGEEHEEHCVLAPALLPPSSAEFCVLSDVDDTLVESCVADQRQFFWKSLTSGPYGRRPVPGAAELYGALRSGSSRRADNPFFYVSGTSWDLYDLLQRMLAHYRFPSGHIRLKDVRRGFGPEPRGQQLNYKLRHMKSLLEFYPRQQFLLIGDSGEADPAIYLELLRSFPGRILGVLIRRVRRLPRSPDALRHLKTHCAERKVPYASAEDARELQSFCLEQGWISSA